jgi:hypothetical protein
VVDNGESFGGGVGVGYIRRERHVENDALAENHLNVTLDKLTILILGKMRVDGLIILDTNG